MVRLRYRRRMNSLLRAARLVAIWTFTLALILLVLAVNLVLFFGRSSWLFGL